MTSPNTPEELEQSLYDLAVNIHELRALEAAIDAVRSEWPMRKVAIPAPPGADEIDAESFHHESSL